MKLNPNLRHALSCRHQQLQIFSAIVLRIESLRITYMYQSVHATSRECASLRLFLLVLGQTADKEEDLEIG